jgi:hypothetical protein
MWTNAVVEATYPQIENASVYSLMYIHRYLYNLERGMYYLNGILVSFLYIKFSAMMYGGLDKTNTDAL